MFKLVQNCCLYLPPIQHGRLRMQEVSDIFISFYSVLKHEQTYFLLVSGSVELHEASSIHQNRVNGPISCAAWAPEAPPLFVGNILHLHGRNFFQSINLHHKSID